MQIHDGFEPLPVTGKSATPYSVALQRLAVALMTSSGATQQQLCKLLDISGPSLRRQMRALAYLIKPFGWEIFRRYGSERSPRVQLRYTAAFDSSDLALPGTGRMPRPIALPEKPATAPSQINGQ